MAAPIAMVMSPVNSKAAQIQEGVPLAILGRVDNEAIIPEVKVTTTNLAETERFRKGPRVLAK